MKRCQCEEPSVDFTSSCLELCAKCGNLIPLTDKDIAIYEITFKAVQSCYDKDSKEYISLKESLERLKKFKDEE